MSGFSHDALRGACPHCGHEIGPGTIVLRNRCPSCDRPMTLERPAQAEDVAVGRRATREMKAEDASAAVLGSILDAPTQVRAAIVPGALPKIEAQVPQKEPPPEEDTSPLLSAPVLPGDQTEPLAAAEPPVEAGDGPTRVTPAPISSHGLDADLVPVSQALASAMKRAPAPQLPPDQDTVPAKPPPRRTREVAQAKEPQPQPLQERPSGRTRDPNSPGVARPRTQEPSPERSPRRGTREVAAVKDRPGVKSKELPALADRPGAKSKELPAVGAVRSRTREQPAVPRTRSVEVRQAPVNETVADRPRSRTHERPAVKLPDVGAPPLASTTQPLRGATRVASSDRTFSRFETLPEGSISQSTGGSLEVEFRPGMTLGGYELVRKIGAGGMGAVWLARQVSLDRHVALKMLHGDMASDPSLVVRFNREAMAAGQLVHHNIVQIHDVGADRGAHFFSMEYVEGETLGHLVRREGRLDAEVSAGYVLQAARGLHYAHQQGMVHRDVKPDNLLLNRHNVVKVADLGLVKLRGALMMASTESTALSEMAMGTPAYIAPEQVQDPAGVDQRADIYSLGCTFYELLTGRPPFEADNAAAMLTKHVYDAPVPAQDIAKRVPPALAEILSHMMAKSPDERYASMGEVITELETFLGVDGAAPFSPREEHADQLERSVMTFNSAIWAKRRRFALIGVIAPVLVAVGVLAYLQLWRWMGSVAGAALVAWWSTFIVRGLLQKTALFLRVRQLVLGAPLTSWILEFLLVGAAGLAIHLNRVHWYAAGAFGAGVLFSVVWYLVLERRVVRERKKPVEEIERMLRSIRLRGLDETALRHFVCKYSGDHWEPFYEQLFGYDAMIAAREKWGRNDRDLQRRRYATWRDPLIRFIDAQQRRHKARKSRRLMRRLEKRQKKHDAIAA